MPQLDLMHFFSQFFWFFIFFSILFFYLRFNVIPFLSKILKYRNKKLLLLSKEINSGKKNVSFLLYFYNNIIFIFFKVINRKILKTKNYFETLITKILNWLFLKKFKSINTKYLLIFTINIYKNFIFNSKIKND